MILPNRIAIPLLMVLGYLLFTVDQNILVTAFVANLVSVVVLLMNWNDYRNYSEQAYVNKVWLQCLAVASFGLFFVLVILLIGFAFGTFSP